MKTIRQQNNFDKLRSLAFSYRETINDILLDLVKIDKLIPAEISRYGCLFNKKDEEAAAIIEARKVDLLRYIQIICRDHIHFGKKLLDDDMWIKLKQRSRHLNTKLSKNTVNNKKNKK